MFGAGAETVSCFIVLSAVDWLTYLLQTAAALSVFMLAMTLYPETMRKAQAQIDAVVGRDRMPTFADRDNLPYITLVLLVSWNVRTWADNWLV